ENKAQEMVTASDNGLACKNIANRAVALSNQSGGGSYVLLQSHFSTTLGNCYYEVNITQPDTVTDEIRAAPNDDWVAYCSYTGGNMTICNARNHQGLMTVQEFNALRGQYLAN